MEELSPIEDLSKEEYIKLVEIFKDNEHELFDDDGFENIVGQVASIEKQLNIYSFPNSLLIGETNIRINLFKS